ncbi:VOC family protein [Nostoc flagelliforme FACHB-838]|uniref:VOC family protein n=1 Tax=Nostoc flagelliforme FACHB-838 TaxID=2692904 RepID=A0ABR8DMY3_9NOSO|nr:VOC family protein [Nostoc flagelliforme]MBD2530270.1 VOC family protein [Nostoc flagelliforme FACHB-838]
MVFQYTNAFITIASVNLDKLVNFYTKLLEEKPVILIPNVYAEFNLGSTRLGIFKPKKTNESEFAAMSKDKQLLEDTLCEAVYTKSKISLCLEVSNLEDAIAHLTTLGYPPPGNISIASHGREIYAYDPDGNRLILHQASVNDN